MLFTIALLYFFAPAVVCALACLISHLRGEA
jgi:hypothetical protein